MIVVVVNWIIGGRDVFGLNVPTVFSVSVCALGVAVVVSVAI